MVYTQYGPPDVLKLTEVDKPVPGDGEVLLKVHAASINAYDWRMLRADPFLIRLMGMGFQKPRNPILGADVAGRVEAVGGGVTQFKPGDAVFGDIAQCGSGGFAEYVCARADVLVMKPANVSFVDVAAIPMAGLTALQGLRDSGQIRSGQKVLINGASGGVGTFAVQIATAFGAEVTAVCSTRNLDMVRSIGASQVIDYTQEDFTKSGQRYDLILAANGYHPVLDYARALSPDGIYVVAGGTMAQIFQTMLLGPFISMTGGKKFRSFTAQSNRGDLAFLAELLETGKVKPVIDRCFPLGEVPDAFRYLEQEHAQGKIVIDLEHGN
jgi:NADPH:quinone reductase-like Zn-dependent oxidoreductase